MDLKTIFILLVIVLALVLIALHVYEYYQLPKECTLLQRDSLSHDQWKQLVKEKQPMIIRKGFSQDKPLTQLQDEQKNLTPDTIDRLNHWTSTLCTHRPYGIHTLDKDLEHPPVRVYAQDNIYLVLEGEIRFEIYLPKEYHKLRSNQSREGVLISPRVCKTYHTSNKDDVEHVQVIIRKGQVLSIPPQFVYSYHVSATPEKPVELVHYLGQTPITHVLAWLKIG